MTLIRFIDSINTIVQPAFAQNDTNTQLYTELGMSSQTITQVKVKLLIKNNSKSNNVDDYLSKSIKVIIINPYIYIVLF